MIAPLGIAPLLALLAIALFAVQKRHALMLAWPLPAPAILFLIERRRRFAAALVFLAARAVLQLLISLSAVMALLTAAGGFALAWWRPRAVALLLAAGFVVLTAVLPLRAPTRDTVIWVGE